MNEDLTNLKFTTVILNIVDEHPAINRGMYDKILEAIASYAGVTANGVIKLQTDPETGIPEVVYRILNNQKQIIKPVPHSVKEADS